MKIIKKINTSAALALDASGHEVVVLGKGSGKMSVPAKCEELGIPYTLNDEQTHEVVGKIKALAIEKQSTVTNEEFVKILSEVK